jgi:hypothetical protein
MCPFSLEGEGFDEEGITNRFYSPLPLGNCSLRCSTSCIHAVVRQEKELSVIALSLCV